jgi:GEVED domain/CARDB/Domain of unknown function DUF11/HYR domain
MMSIKNHFLPPLSILLLLSHFLVAQNLPMLVKDINVGTADANPTYFTNFNNAVYFTAFDGVNSNLYRTNGTDAGTEKILDNVRAVTAFNGSLYFLRSRVSGTSNVDVVVLYQSNGSRLNETLIDTLQSGFISSIGLSVLGNRLVVNISYQTPRDVISAVFISNGIRGGLYRLTDTFFQTRVGTSSSAYYRISDDSYWIYQSRFGNGVTPSASIFKRNPDGTNSNAFWSNQVNTTATPNISSVSFTVLGVAGSRLIFAAYPNNAASPFPAKRNLYSLDANGSIILLKSSIDGIKGIGISGNLEYYITDVNEMWRTDGTVAGTIRLTTGSPNTPQSITQPTNIGDALYFTDAPSTTFRFWRIRNSETAPTEVGSLQTGANFAPVIANVGGTPYIFTNNNNPSISSTPIYSIAGTFVNSVGGFDKTNFAFLNGDLLMNASPSGLGVPTPLGRELWKVNLTPSVSQLPDLTLANLTIPTPSVQAGQILNWRADFRNICTAAASGNFNVKAYISTDNTLSADDIQDGVVPTGNYAAGFQTLQVPGASTIPATLAAGNYYLILKIDADNQVAESDENNNVLVSTTTFSVNNTSLNACIHKFDLNGLLSENCNTTLPPSYFPFFGYLQTRGASLADGIQLFTRSPNTFDYNAYLYSNAVATTTPPAGSVFNNCPNVNWLYFKMYGYGFDERFQYLDSNTVVRVRYWGTIANPDSVLVEFSNSRQSLKSVSKTTNCNSCIATDRTPPTINCPTTTVNYSQSFSPDRLSLQDILAGSGVTATDNCGVQLVGRTLYNAYWGGVYPIKLIAYDSAGNSAVCNFNLRLSCPSFPLSVGISNCPRDTTIAAATGQNCRAYSWTVPTFGSSGSPSAMTSNFAPNHCFPIGTTRVVYTAKDSCGNSATCAFNITVTGGTTSGTYCASKATAPWELWISNVKFGTINNTSDKFKDFATLGYSDYTNLSTSVAKGQNTPLSITPSLSWIGNLPNAFCRAWIDFNNNKTFESNELVLERTNANPLTANVLIPNSAITGSVRMRVSVKWGAYPTPCETFDKGEVEDYTIQITEGGVCTPTTLSFVQRCPNDTTITIPATQTCATVRWTEPTVVDNCGNPIVISQINGFANGACFPVRTEGVSYRIGDPRFPPFGCNFNVTVVQQTTNQPDLTAQNLTIPTPSVQAGQILNWRADFRNIGTGAATGNFNIKAYISTDNVLSANDIQDGIIPTANYAAGLVQSQVPGASTIPATLAAGNYYLILKIDADNQIAESNENNNVLVSSTPFLVTRTTICANPISIFQYQTRRAQGDALGEFSYQAIAAMLGTNISQGVRIEESDGIIFSAGYTSAQRLIFAKNGSTTPISGINYPPDPIVGGTWLYFTGTYGALHNPYASVPTYFADSIFSNGRLRVKYFGNASTPDSLYYQVINSDGSLGFLRKSFARVQTCTACRNDAVAPVFANCKDTVTTGAIPFYSVPQGIATDNCTADAFSWGNPLVFQNRASLEQVGNNQSIVYTAFDGVGNMSRCTIKVIVNNTATADVKIGMTAPSVFTKFAPLNFTISAQNLGSQAFTNAIVEFKYPTGTVSGGQVTPSVGTWQEFCAGGVQCFQWKIPSLAGNTTATLQVPLFVLTPPSPIVATAKLLSSTPTDGNAANNMATISIAAAAGTQPLQRTQPTQLVPIVIQSIRPTLTEGDVVIDIESLLEKEIRVDFYDLNGKILQTEKRAIQKGMNQLPFDVWGLPQGVYFIQTDAGVGRGTPIKFVKM